MKLVRYHGLLMVMSMHTRLWPWSLAKQNVATTLNNGTYLLSCTCKLKFETGNLWYVSKQHESNRMSRRSLVQCISKTKWEPEHMNQHQNSCKTRRENLDYKSTMNCFINFSISSSFTSSLSIGVSLMSYIDTRMLENTFAFLSAISSYEIMWWSTDWYGWYGS